MCVGDSCHNHKCEESNDGEVVDKAVSEGIGQSLFEFISMATSVLFHDNRTYCRDRV